MQLGGVGDGHLLAAGGAPRIAWGVMRLARRAGAPSLYDRTNTAQLTSGMRIPLLVVPGVSRQAVSGIL